MDASLLAARDSSLLEARKRIFVVRYSAGKLHLEEERVAKQLANGHVNLDCTFCIIFTDPSDGRDLRPLIYPGKLLFPGYVKTADSAFWSCNLRKQRRTQDVKQVRHKDMKILEDLSEDSLPDAGNKHEHIGQAERYAQIGPDGALALLEALNTGTNHESQPAHNCC